MDERELIDSPEGSLILLTILSPHYSDVGSEYLTVKMEEEELDFCNEDCRWCIPDDDASYELMI